MRRSRKVDWARFVSENFFEFHSALSLPLSVLIKISGISFSLSQTLSGSYIWSKRHIIAAVSRSKVSLYHPFNGYTRALDIHSSVCIAFSNEGHKLAMVYRRSQRDIAGKAHPDVYIFDVDEVSLFHNADLDTVKLASMSENDITAVCFGPDSSSLVCGTAKGELLVIDFSIEMSEKSSRVTTFGKQMLAHDHHDDEIIKIAFSCKYLHFASMSQDGDVVLWEWASRTPIHRIAIAGAFIAMFEWHPFVNDELLLGSYTRCGLHLFSVSEKRVVASYENSTTRMFLRSISFNPVNAQLAVNFWNHDEEINRVCILASMSEVLNSFDFDYFESSLQVFWNSNGTMLGAGGRCFRFAFWSYDPSGEFAPKAMKNANNKNPEPLITTLNDTKLSSLR